MGKNTEGNTTAKTNEGNKDRIRAVKPLYTDCSIPAKLFFTIANKKDYSLLGEGSDEDLKNIYDQISEEFAYLNNGKELASVYNTYKKTWILETVIAHAETLLYALVYMPLTEKERDEVIEIINKVPLLNANIDKNKDISEEALRVKKQSIGILHNELNMIAPDDKKENENDKEEIIFESELARICLTLGFQVSNTISLYEYAEYKKTALSIAKKRLTQQH